MGLRYQRRLAEKMKTEFGRDRVVASQWFEYFMADDDTPHYAETDVFILGDNHILLLECKLTYTEQLAWWQMEKRYAPLLRHVYNRSVLTMQVCRNLDRGRDVEALQMRTPRYLFNNPEPGRFTWHWLGR